MRDVGRISLAVVVHHHITTSPHHDITTSPHHHITTSPHHHITTSPHAEYQNGRCHRCGHHGQRHRADIRAGRILGPPRRRRAADARPRARIDREKPLEVRRE